MKSVYTEKNSVHWKLTSQWNQCTLKKTVYTGKKPMYTEN